MVTNKRIIVKIGIFSRRTLEMNLNKIESVNVDQNIFGRMFGYGTITIIGTGGTREAFPNIGDAVEFRKRFQEVSSSCRIVHADYRMKGKEEKSEI